MLAELQSQHILGAEAGRVNLTVCDLHLVLDVKMDGDSPQNI
jgi:hypothetical protein